MAPLARSSSSVAAAFWGPAAGSLAAAMKDAMSSTHSSWDAPERLEMAEDDIWNNAESIQSKNNQSVKMKRIKNWGKQTLLEEAFDVASLGCFAFNELISICCWECVVAGKRRRDYPQII